MKRVAIGRSDVLRGQYMADIDVFDPSMLVFVDESGFDRRNLIRQFGYGYEESPQLLISCLCMVSAFLQLVY